MTTLNPIDEIKRIRHQLGADVDYDVRRVFAELRELQATSSRSYVQHPPRRVCEFKPETQFLESAEKLFSDPT